MILTLFLDKMQQTAGAVEREETQGEDVQGIGDFIFMFTPSLSYSAFFTA